MHLILFKSIFVWYTRIDMPTGSFSGFLLPICPVFSVGLVEHVLAADLGLQAGADEEGAAHLAVQRVGFLRRRSQTLLQHHRNQTVDPLRCALGTEVKRLV